MKNLYLLIALFLVAGGVAAKNPYLPPEGLPGSLNEMVEAGYGIPALTDFTRSGLNVEHGYERLLLGSQIPVAPGPHIPWAKPYFKPPRILIFHMINLGDTYEVAQLVRELDCDPRFVLIADIPLVFDFGKDEAYRLGYLAEQARTALKEDYDAIVFALGCSSPGFGAALLLPIFPDDVYQTILAKTKQGTGLVFIGRGPHTKTGGSWLNDTILKEAAPALLTGKFQWVEKPELVFPADGAFAGLADNLPESCIWEYQTNSPSAKVAAQVSGKPLIYTGQFGEGRTVMLTYDGTLGPLATMNQNRGMKHYDGTPQQFEHGLAMAIRAVLYAAKAEPQVRVVPQATSATAGQPVPVATDLSGAAVLDCMVREANNDVRVTVTLKGVKGSQKLALPALPAGNYWVDMIARNGAGAILGWGSARLTITAPQTVTIATDKDVYAVGDTVTVRGQVTGDVPQARIQVSVSDATGRLLSQGPASGIPAQFTYAYPVQATVTAPHTAVVELFQGKAPLLRREVEFFVPQRGWDDYVNVLWPNNWTIEPNAQMRDVGGFTGVMGSWYEDITEKWGSRVGLRGSRMNDGTLSPAEVQLKAPDPQTHNMTDFKKTIEIARKYGDLALCFQDERGLMADPGMPEPPALAVFQEYLKQQYGTIEKLNASWERSYKTWNEVKPMLTAELTAETKNLAPWLDLRVWVAERSYQIDKAKADAARSVLGPEMPVGIDGFTSSGHVIPYGGVDIGRLLTTGVFNHYCPYGDDLMIAAFLRTKMVKFIGWSMSREEFMGNPWRDLFRGHWGTYRFMGQSFYSGFGWLLPSGVWTEEGTRVIRNGCGKLLMHSERQFAPVAILYSYPSMMATGGSGIWVEKGNNHLMTRPSVCSRDAMEQMLVKNGITFQYVIDNQLAKGALKGLKLLFIPQMMGIALSDEACAAIKQFVADGGYVVADMSPAMLDEHGKPRQSGGLNDLFGIERTSIAYGQRSTDYLVGIMETDPWLPNNTWFVGEWYEKGIKVTDGKAFGEHVFEKIPAFIVKNTGKGRAMLWNFLNTSTLRRNGEPEKEDVALMARILLGSGVTPYLKVPGCEVNVFRDHGAEYIGVYPFVGSSQSVPGYMQMATGAMSGGGATGSKAGLLHFFDMRETYDARTGTYLGKLQDVPLPVKQNAALIARLDYRVTGLAVKAAKPDRQTVELALALKATDKPGRHVVHLDVLDPTGVRNFFYTQNVELFDGQGKATLHLALNDQPGKWKIIAREVVSGTTATTTFTVK